MKINEVLRLPEGTEVTSESSTFIVKKLCGIKVLARKEDGIQMFATLDVIEADYELVRKKLTFFEAMKLVDEGRKVQNSQHPKTIYQKIDGGLQINASNGFTIPGLFSSEIKTDWYEVIE